MDLRSYLRTTGTTPTAFASALGVHYSAVYRYITGKRTPPIRRAREIEKLTGGKVRLRDWATDEPRPARRGRR